MPCSWLQTYHGPVNSNNQTRESIGSLFRIDLPVDLYDITQTSRCYQLDDISFYFIKCGKSWTTWPLFPW